MPNPFTMSDIRGFNRLVREVTGEFVDVVEDLHVTIAEPLLSTHASASALARGITGLAGALGGGAGVLMGIVSLWRARRR